jgi:hypothetical protein
MRPIMTARLRAEGDLDGVTRWLLSQRSFDEARRTAGLLLINEERERRFAEESQNSK